MTHFKLRQGPTRIISLGARYLGLERFLLWSEMFEEDYMLLIIYCVLFATHATAGKAPFVLCLESPLALSFTTHLLTSVIVVLSAFCLIF